MATDTRRAWAWDSFGVGSILALVLMIVCLVLALIGQMELKTAVLVGLTNLAILLR